MYAFLATVIAKAMFPAGDDFAAMLGTFGAFGLGFAARPLGAIIFGWLGDKKGRKWTLTFVMPLMAVATLFMALIPSYATIGGRARAARLRAHVPRACPSEASSAMRSHISSNGRRKTGAVSMAAFSNAARSAACYSARASPRS